VVVDELEDVVEAFAGVADEGVFDAWPMGRLRKRRRRSLRPGMVWR